MVHRFALVSVLSLSLAGPAAAIIDKVRICGKDFDKNSTVPLIIGVKNNLEVSGGLVDTASRVEDAGLGGVQATITQRTGGIGSKVTIQIDVASSAKDGDEGEIRLRYPIEVAGFDKFKVRLHARAKINSLVVDGIPTESDGVHVPPGRQVTFIARGTNLDHLGLAPSWSAAGTARMVSTTATEARFTFTPTTSRQLLGFSRLDFTSDPAFCSGTVDMAFQLNVIVRSASSGGGTAPPPPATGGGGGGTAPGPTRTPTPPPPPDLVATKSGSLLRPGPNRQIDSSFCTNLPAPPRADQAATGTVTVPPFRWGVINSSNTAVNTAFTVRLETGTGQVVATETVNALTAGGNQTFEMRRAQNQTKVIRIDAVTNATTKSQYGGPAANGCFQLIMQASDPLNWKDPDILKIKVDTGNTVNEGPGGEINNEISF